jgi:hypothetical protein
VVFLSSQSENHPDLAISGGFAFIILLIARSPLLAVLQGGEYCFPNNSL